MLPNDPSPLNFNSLNLLPEVAAIAAERQYATPTAIQARTIPLLLEGRDVLGQADTGTGKTAAFAMPLLSMVDPKSRITQVLVLTPTRELAIQVASSFAAYGRKLAGLNVQAIYGGAPYSQQIRELKRGVQIVVGTPGRVMDHMRRGGLDVSDLACLVLDEADEMLRMGFVDDVTWILEQTPANRQIALFSATMPEPIRRIADTHLRNPAVVQVQQKNQSEADIRARYLITSWKEKSQALLRVLEAEDTDAVIVFTKTRETTLRVADELLERGYAAVAINGDIPQKQREQTIEQLRSGKLKILVATDVAARGLDVARISHVINYDLPVDNQTWVHRIGRTGRAGRSGEAILFISYNERRYLKGLERESRQPITQMQLPSNSEINLRRQQSFEQRVLTALKSGGIAAFRPMVESIREKTGAAVEDIAAAIAAAMHGDMPFLLPEESQRRSPAFEERRPVRPANDRPEHQMAAPQRAARSQPPARPQHAARTERAVRPERAQRPARPPRDPAAVGVPPLADAPRKARRSPHRGDEGMERFRIEVGHTHGVQPGNIVGAIANEAGLESKHIGKIDIRDDHSFVDLPEGMPKQIFRDLKDTVVLGRHLRITRTVPLAARNARPPRRDDGVRRPSRKQSRDAQRPQESQQHGSHEAAGEATVGAG